MPWSSQTIERAKPLLGTRVSVRVTGLERACGNAAINAAFAEITKIHGLMSFHRPGSDVSRLNKTAHLTPVTVDSRTLEVLKRALEISALSDGDFDITVAPRLVANGQLPSPAQADRPDPHATWADIVLLPDCRVTFKRPLWIDLGGIAKGYAVDRAMEQLQALKPVQACVNAGGDMRIAGSTSELVRLRPDDFDPTAVPVIDLHNGSLASSCGPVSGRRRRGIVHIHAKDRRAPSPRIFVSVAAPSCTDADALTKVVMTQGPRARPLLARLSAQAVIHDAINGWRQLGGNA